MKKLNLLVAAVMTGLGIQAQAVGFKPSSDRSAATAKTTEAAKSWSRVQVRLGKAVPRPAVIKVAWDLPKPPRPRPVPPTCGVRG